MHFATILQFYKNKREAYEIFIIIAAPVQLPGHLYGGLMTERAGNFRFTNLFKIA